MAVVSRQHGYLFIAVPGAGSTATAHALVSHCGGEWLPERDMPERGVNRKHSSVPQLVAAGLVTEQELQSWLVFGSVRNPFDYWPSEWLRCRRWFELLSDPNSWIQKDPHATRRARHAVRTDFARFVRDELLGPFWKRPSDWLRGRSPWRPRHVFERHIEGVPRLMRMESLQQDFDAVIKELGLPQLTIQSINVSEDRDRDYRQYYDDATRRLVERIHAPDLERFGYAF